MNQIGGWLGVSHKVGPMMTYWILPKSGKPISTNTVQRVIEAEIQTDAVQGKMEEWKVGTLKILDAKSQHISWDQENILKKYLFDIEQEGEEFLCAFNMKIVIDDEPRNKDDDGDSKGTVEPENYLSMEIGLRRGTEGELK